MDLSGQDPLSGNFKVFLVVHEAEGFVKTEHLQLFILLLFACLSQEEIRHFLVEFLYIFRRQVHGLSSNKGHVNSVNQVLIGLIHHLIENERKPCRGIHDLPHHDQQLSDDHCFVQLVGNRRQVLLVESDASILDDEDSEAVVVAVHQDCLRDRETYELIDDSQLSVTNDNVLVLLEVASVIKETNVDRLLSVDLIAVLAEALSYSEFSNDALVMLIFVLYLVGAFRAKPLVSPHLKVEVSLRERLVVALLQLANEVM